MGPSLVASPGLRTGRSRQHNRRHRFSTAETIALSLLLSIHIPSAFATVYPSRHELYKFDYLSVNDLPHQNSKTQLSKRQNPIPLIVTNKCPDTIWPGIATQNGEGPESGGFELAPGGTKNLTVGPTWQGRVWGRTNCTVSNNTASCATGDCFGLLNCQYGGAPPVTLAEFNLAGGVTGKQTFYDLSLVDGYNLPVGLVYQPAANTTSFPPNLVNPSCIATSGYLTSSSRTGLAYTNSSYPMPYETAQTNNSVARWCPWDLQAYPPDKPGDGVYPYPDDNIQRPTFDPCRSACLATGAPWDCCTDSYDSPGACSPSLYSRQAKSVCPDAYSYAFDDQTSTFIIPSGGGWEVVFCPEGRSTDILATFGPQLSSLAAGGSVTPDILSKVMNLTFIESVPSVAPRVRGSGPVLATLIAVGVSFFMI